MILRLPVVNTGTFIIPHGREFTSNYEGLSHTSGGIYGYLRLRGSG